jgi:hypothetical protein
MKFHIDSIFIIISILIPLIFFGCTLTSENNFPDDEVLRVYTEEEGPRMYPFIMAIPVEDKWIIFHNNHVYRFIYTPWKRNNNISYYNFLKKVLAEETELKFKYLTEGGYFVVNKNQRIIIEHNENGFNYIMNKYLIEENAGLILNTNLTDEDYYGLIKVMFYQGFIVMFDDLNGKLTFTLPDNLPVREKSPVE